MDNSTYFNVIVTKSIPITELIYQIFKEHLSQTIVNKATLLYNSLKCCLELLSLLSNNQNLPR